MIFGGKQAMIESPLLKELTDEAEARGRTEARTEARQEAIVDILVSRFGSVPDDLAGAVRTLGSEERLGEAIKLAARCPDLEAFRVHLRADGE